MAVDRAVDVLVVGGGPFGLMLANELGRRGVGLLLVDQKPGTAVAAQANATQARTMEYFRRLGFADEVRALGLPPDHPTDIVYCTRFAGYELARLRLPSAAEAKASARSLGGSWSVAELPHRVSQKYVEAVMRRHAEALPGVELRFGARLVGFSESGGGVSAEIEDVDTGRQETVQARYLVGGDGARSTVRAALRIAYAGEGARERDLMGGRMYAVNLRAPHFHADVGLDRAWMHVTFNPDRRAFMCTVDGEGEFAFHTQLRPGENEDEITDADAIRMFHAAAGKAVDAEVLWRGGWSAGRALVAERFGEGRVFIGGDAAHLFTPAGGLGYNTAVEDAVNLAWKLAGVLKGQAGPGLLASYEAERRPVAERNVAYARLFADSLGLLRAPPEIEDPTPAGAAAREAARRHFEAHARLEFDIPGVTLGVRYDGSPLIVADGTTPPPDRPNIYEPTASPGGRAPHAWLDGGESLYDRLGFDWTLLDLGQADPAPLARAAAERGVRLQVLSLRDPALRALYEAELTLIRPDQVVAWRGRAAADPAGVWSRLLGDG